MSPRRRELHTDQGVVHTPPGVRIQRPGKLLEPESGGVNATHGPQDVALAPIVDRLVRLYAYCVRYLDTVGTYSSGRGSRQPLTRATLERRIHHYAELYPGLFGAYLEYPSAFEDLEYEPLEAFLSRLPASVSAWDMDRAVQRLTGVDFPPLLGMSSAPRRRWRILELPGSMGRYSGLLCRAYPELEPERNCFVLRENPFESSAGMLRSAATYVNVLLTVGHGVADPLGASGRAPEHVVHTYSPDIMAEAEGFDLIVGSWFDLEEQVDEYSSPSTSAPKREALEQGLAAGGDLLLLNVPLVRL